MAVSRVDVVIFDSQITAMSLPGGEVWRWARQRSERVERLAKMNVHNRSFQLYNSIEAFYEGTSGRDDCQMLVTASAPHALYVHEGTQGTPPGGGPLMFLPPYGPYPAIRTRHVRGQRANPFLTDALFMVMADL